MGGTEGEDRSCDQWGDVIALLQKKYPGKPSVAIYPNADFQYMRSPDGKPAYHEIHPAH